MDVINTMVGLGFCTNCASLMSCEYFYINSKIHKLISI